MNSSFDSLYKEYEKLIIGPLIYEEIEQIALKNARTRWSKLSSRYNGNVGWRNEHGQIQEEEFRALAAEVISARLLEEKQIHYIFEHATDIKHFRNLIFKNFQRTLNKRLETTYVDRLLTRITEMQNDSENQWEYAKQTAGYEELTDRQIAGIVEKLRDLPQIAENPLSERASMVYRKQDLKEIVLRVRDEVSSISKYDFEKILRQLLIGWTPEPPLSIETEVTVTIKEPGNGTNRIEDEELLMEAQKYVSELADQDVNILWQRLQGRNYNAIAKEAGLTYQTVSTRFKKLIEGAKQFVGDQGDAQRRSDFLIAALNGAIGEGES